MPNANERLLRETVDAYAADPSESTWERCMDAINEYSRGRKQHQRYQVPSLAYLHKLTPESRLKHFERMTPKQLDERTEPCIGRAHSSKNAEGCPLCAFVVYGRMLRRLQ